MKANVIFEILFLVLIGQLNQHVAGQSSLSLDLHKQSQRTKQAAPTAETATSKRDFYSGHDLKSFRQKRHSPSTSKKHARQLDQNGTDLATNADGLPIRFVDFQDSTTSISDALPAATTAAPEAPASEQQTPSSDSATSFQITTTTTSRPEASSNGQSKTTATMRSSTTSQPNYELSSAELCYLANGGSSLTLTVNEACPVGTLIGTIDVNGEPALEGGNVDLELETPDTSQQQVDHSSSSRSLQASAQAIAGSSMRQMRRLLGRRDMESRPPSAALTPALRLEPGTRDLMLARSLDKESAEGASGLVINVKCRPRVSQEDAPARSRTSKPQASIIPVRLIVTDANDHAPQFLGQQPFVINISETTPANSPVGSARELQALDRDSAGPHSTILYHVLEQSGAPAASSSTSAANLQQQQRPAENFANLSHHFAFSNPLEPVLWLTHPLDYDNLPAPSFTITIVAQDQAEPEPLQTQAQVQINVLDFDDQNPRFLDEKYTLVMDELQSSSVGQPLRVVPRQLRAEDGDRGIGAPILYAFDSHSGNTFLASSRLLDAFGSTGDPGASGNLVTTATSRQDPTSDEYLLLNIDSYLHLNPASGELRLLRQWPRHKWPSGAGPLTLVVRAAQVDNRDRYALTTLTITPRASPNATTHLLDATSRSSLKTSSDKRQGIAFQRDKIFLQVPEDSAVNEKLVRLRAFHLDEGPLEQAEGASNQTAGGRNMRLPAGEVEKQTNERPASEKRPISYQLLDDQMDQFGVNALGEIFLKRPLDFEQRQEFRLRVLASYTKHSDICQVHLAVANVNDNKPKYSFHLTESRLRSNLIGVVQAHDADLNDTLEYSILTAGAAGAANSHVHSAVQEPHCAQLFEFANPASGQLSLKTTIRQLNVSQCHFLVQVSDTLGLPASRHQQQARVSINVTPQIIGRSINLFAASTPAATPAAQGQQPRRAPGEQRNKKSSAGDPGESSTASSVILQYQPTTTSVGRANQRSSLATVMASLQHMAKGMNFLEMPMSSALLLSVLLAFLVCLLLIVVVSMGVHVYRRRTKSRRRKHLAATAHLRHAHMASASAPRGPISPYKTGSSSYTTSTTSASPGSHSSASSVNSTAGHLQQVAKTGRQSNPKNGRKQNFFDNLGLATSVVEIANIRHHQQEPAARQNAGSNEEEPNGNTTNDTSLTTASSANAKGSPIPAAGSGQSEPRADLQKGLRQPLEELKISTDLEPAGGNSKPAAGTYVKSTTPPRMNANSLVSSLTATSCSRQSNSTNSHLGASVLSSDEEDSSVIHCGHYSVNNTIKQPNGQRAKTKGQHQQLQPKETYARKGHTNRLLNEINSELAKQQKTKAPKKQPQQQESRQQVSSSIEAAIRSLVRQEQDNEDDDEQQRQVACPRLANKFKMLDCEELNEVSELTSAGKPGIKSYRQLPLMNSLVRPVRSQLLSLVERNKVSPQERSSQQEQQIRWPSGAFPQRIKKLTWDDELSCCQDGSLERRRSSDQLDCYISPDVQLVGPISPLGPEHQYSTPQAQRPLEYLYSPSSKQNVPRPNYSNYLPPLNGGQAQAEHLARNNCLDYTIVQTSQFHADSLIGSAAAAIQAGSSNVQSIEAGDYLNSNHEAPSEHYYYEQTTLARPSHGSSSGSSSQLAGESGHTGAATYKLNENYQDLKLMTTAVL